MLAKRGGDRGSRDERNGGFQFEKEGGSFRVALGSSQILVPEQTLVITGLVLLGLGAIIGERGFGKHAPGTLGVHGSAWQHGTW